MDTIVHAIHEKSESLPIEEREEFWKSLPQWAWDKYVDFLENKPI